VNTYKLSDSEMKKFSITKLPTSLNESIAALLSDNNFLKPILGEDFLEMYLSNLKLLK